VGVNDAPGTPATHVLCIDLDSPCVDDSGGKSLLDPDGSDSSYLRDMLSILGELVTGKEKTEQFIATLLSLDLLAPVVLDIALDDGTPLQLEGLYGLDEETFRQLEEQQLAGLWRTGYLDHIYAVMIASGQIFNLIRLKNQRIALNRAWHSKGE
jgi:hypothetical protein